MKVKELIEQLKKVDPEHDIIMSADPEGNSYHQLHSINVNDYVYEGDYWVNIGISELTDHLKKFGYGEEDVLDGDPCVVLWPK